MQSLIYMEVDQDVVLATFTGLSEQTEELNANIRSARW